MYCIYICMLGSSYNMSFNLIFAPLYLFLCRFLYVFHLLRSESIIECLLFLLQSSSISRQLYFYNFFASFLHHILLVSLCAVLFCNIKNPHSWRKNMMMVQRCNTIFCNTLHSIQKLLTTSPVFSITIIIIIIFIIFFLHQNLSWVTAYKEPANARSH